ncbi:MAG TPA: Asp-tRNA(Asn)/Glu-tRNA(Gln) amidotransferase subunit GatB [Candidatus Saccharibacteria bacterium]|nr:Asp-tRNA(Asn)/Glu-tRNA(Gln) amidotransferase subunit GatB [Candidatus Saccharibacteria bacterium]HRK94481.1 Asp-tRNA(Asn)/Glu-tRNA(Gln) amidotransferase subunit GatB [Candidatus Saccharibacteria bacterium]
MDKWQMTIGIECHVQLATKSKLFSPADNDARTREPNSVVHPIDYGLPGMLPLLNQEAVTLAVKAAKALNADVAKISRFDRKHYFYPDLPSGYQITQMYQPTILAGQVEVPLPDGSTVNVRIHHAHIEADAGKLTHFSDHTLVDLNRAGTPLIEIVSEADMHSPAEARAYCTELYRLMTYAGVTHGDLYHGNMRFDVNISVAEKGSETLGKRAEVKNLNSFRSVEKAAEYEFKRQVELIEKGERIIQETRGWDDAKMKTTSQRSKEDAQDYRYMPDADLPPIELTDEQIANIQSTLPMLPTDYRRAFSSLVLDSSVINTLLANQKHAETVWSVLKHGDEHAVRVANWFASVFKASAEEDDLGGMDEKQASVDDLLTLSKMTAEAKVSSTAAKELFLALVAGETDPEAIAQQRGLMQVSDESAIAVIVEEVLADPASQKALADVRAGNDKAIGYLVGQVMKQSKGQANPALAQKLIRERL